MNNLKKIDLEQLLIDASLRAGKHLRDHAFDPGTIKWKGPDDPVTVRDVEAEGIIVDTFCEYLDLKIIGEESGKSKSCSGDSRYTAIIDPLDGTKSYLRRDFDSTVSVGLEEDGVLIGGVVYDFMRDIMYVGFRGETYLMNAGSKHDFGSVIANSNLGILTNSDPKKVSPENALKIEAMRVNPDFYISGRRGSIALGMAQTAFGIHDAMIHFKQGNGGNIWDVAAGAYLLQCEGFTMLDGRGDAYDYKNPGKGIVVYKENDLQTLMEYV